MEGKRWREPGAAWEELWGKRIVLAGTAGAARDWMDQNLAAFSAKYGNPLRMAENVDRAEEGDYVLLFAQPERNADDRTGTGKAGRGTWVATAEKYSSTQEDWKPAWDTWDDTIGLLHGMEVLAGKRPAAVLLLSGPEVYGKCFGVTHPLSEEELGYVSHTDRRDAAAQCMRTAEHFACRFAAEGRLPIRVARVGEFPAGEAGEELLGKLLEILLYGENGEIYNLSGREAGEGNRLPLSPSRGIRQMPMEAKAGEGDRSPLSPAPIRLNTEKAEELLAGIPHRK